MTDYKAWLTAQRQEAIFWSVQNYNLIEQYTNQYSIFNTYIMDILHLYEDNTILDIGCGAVAYSAIFGFKNLVLYDSLMDDYLNLDKTKTNLLLHNCIKVQGKSEEIIFDDFYFDNIFCLNMLDHTQDPTKSFFEISRILKKDGLLFFSCDLRDKIDDCHPNIITQNYINWLIESTKLSIVEERTIKSPNFICYQGILRRI